MPNESREIPQYFKVTSIVHKGAMLDNIEVYTSLLSLVSEKVQPESQCGFKAGRSTDEMIFLLIQIHGKVTEQQQPPCTVFVDSSKTFHHDTV